MTTATVTRLPTSSRPAVRRTPRGSVRRMRRQAMAGAAVGFVALTLTALSLTHLAAGIKIVTQAPTWEAWAMAVGIDLGFVVLEMAQIVANEKLRRAMAKWAGPAIVGTLIGSAVLNAFAFGAQATGLMIVPAVILGLAIPALIYALTRIGAAMLLDKTK